MFKQKFIIFLGFWIFYVIIVNMLDTIKKHKDFKAHQNAPYILDVFFIAKTDKAVKHPIGRYGLIVTKKTFKSAVDRNRAKRLLRVWFRANLSEIKTDQDYIFIARKSILTADFETGLNNMCKCIRKLNKNAAIKLKKSNA